MEIPLRAQKAFKKSPHILERLYQKIFSQGEDHFPILNLQKDSWIIFSDLHRGARNRADDFKRCERAFNSALAYYFHMGHTLVILGDAEELWEERPSSVLKFYRHSLTWEARFYNEKKYIRIWGNHDDLWQYKHPAQRLLAPVLGASHLDIPEAVCVRVMNGNEFLGHFFLIHGHQVDALSSDWGSIARCFVRWIWRPFQRITGISLNTPAEDWALRQKFDMAMYEWAEAKEKLLVIAGHTHRPVFRSLSHADQIRMALQRKKVRNRKKEAMLYAQLEWILTPEQGEAQEIQQKPIVRKPCYFNVGCCCYADGDITGIEITKGELRLVRWPDPNGNPNPYILAKENLKEVFARC